MVKQDEKIINRRKRRNKRRARRLAIVMVVMLFIIAFIFGAVYFVADKYLAVKDVIVCGSSMYSCEEITQVANISTSGEDNMIFMRTGAIEDRLLKQLPYIGEATIYREFPDTIIIEVTPAQPFAQICTDVGCWLIDKDKKVLECLDTVDVAYDFLSVQTTSQHKQEAGEQFIFEDEGQSKLYNKIISASKEFEIADKLNNIEMHDKYDLNMLYDNRIRIECGDYGNIEDKIRFAATIIFKRNETDKGIIDVVDTKKATFTLTRG